jgi:hypothetical protein
MPWKLRDGSITMHKSVHPDMRLRRDKRCHLGAGLPPLTSKQAVGREVKDPAGILVRRMQKEFKVGGSTAIYSGCIESFDPEHGYHIHYGPQHGDAESDCEDLGILEARDILAA